MFINRHRYQILIRMISAQQQGMPYGFEDVMVVWNVLKSGRAGTGKDDTEPDKC